MRFLATGRPTPVCAHPKPTPAQFAALTYESAPSAGSPAPQRRPIAWESGRNGTPACQGANDLGFATDPTQSALLGEQYRITSRFVQADDALQADGARDHRHPGRQLGRIAFLFAAVHRESGAARLHGDRLP